VAALTSLVDAGPRLIGSRVVRIAARWHTLMAWPIWSAGSSEAWSWNSPASPTCHHELGAVLGCVCVPPPDAWHGPPLTGLGQRQFPQSRDQHLACPSRSLEDCPEAEKVLAVSPPDRDSHERRCQAGEPGWLTAVPQGHPG
jgi:hypothetical protein